MSCQSRLVNATLLADGQVLVTGGSPVCNAMTTSITAPKSGTRLPALDRRRQRHRARLYHSTPLLLPDASVLVGGGGAPGPQNNRNVEIYYPPYLYDATGSIALSSRN